MEVTGDEITEVVQRQFERLPPKRKPQARGDGLQEWVPLSGIVAQISRDSLKCLSLGTGMKCLPQNKVSQAQGVVLHDWHAEIVAIRAFNQFLLKECQALALSQDQRSDYLRRRAHSELTDFHFQPFALNEDVSLHMYCSEAPCGDASMELTIAAQDDPTPWPPSHPESPSLSLSPASSFPTPLQGRGYFSHLGLTRRKPSRPDAPPTLSKSCSDKLSFKQTTSLLSAPVSLLISPEHAYLSSLTLPASQYSRSGCERAFSGEGRMALLKGRGWDAGYAFYPFEIKSTEREFCFSRRSAGLEGKQEQKLVPSNLAAVWTPYLEETLIGGVLQGRKQFDPRGASGICRKRMWKLAAEVAALVAVPAVSQALSVGSYELVKANRLLDGRRMVKEEVKETVLKGWVSNEGDEGWSLEEGLGDVIERVPSQYRH